MYTSPSSFPVALSYARSIAPRWPDGVVKKPPSPADEQRLRDERPQPALPAGPRNVQPFQGGMIAHVVGRLAVRNLPRDVALVHVIRGDASPWWFDQWQSLNIETAAAATFGGARRNGVDAGGNLRSGRRIWRPAGRVPEIAPRRIGGNQSDRSGRGDSNPRTACRSPDPPSRRPSWCRRRPMAASAWPADLPTC